MDKVFALAWCIGVAAHVTLCFAAPCQPSTWIAGWKLCGTVGFLGLIRDAPASGSVPFPGNSYSSCWLPFFYASLLISMAFVQEVLQLQRWYSL